MAEEASLNISVVEGFASAQSREKFSSSCTACVFDVSVGKVDLCLADFWITPERLKFSRFVTAFDQDLMFLWVPNSALMISERRSAQTCRRLCVIEFRKDPDKQIYKIYIYIRRPHSKNALTTPIKFHVTETTPT